MHRLFVVALLFLLLGIVSCTQTARAPLARESSSPSPTVTGVCATSSSCAAAVATKPVTAPIAALTATPASCPPGPCDVALDIAPANANVAPGGTISVTIEATPRATVHLGTFIIDLHYDPAVLKPLACEEQLSQCNLAFSKNAVRLVGASSEAQFAFPTKQPAQSASSPSQAPGPPSHGEPLAVLTFRAIGAAGASSPLGLTAVALTDPQGQPSTTAVAGAALRVQDAGTNAPLGATDVGFADPLHGWALGAASPCSDCSGQAVLWSTSDGGQSWQRLPAPRLTAGARVPQEQHVLFLNQQDGFLYDPDLYETHDGGQSWSEGPGWTWFQLVSSGGRLLALREDCSGVTDASYCGKDLTTFVSDDVGRTWSKLADPPPVGVTTLLTAPNSARIWWFSSNAITLYYSDDNGQSWQFVGLTPPCGAPLPAFAAGRIWLVCKGQGVQGLEFRSVNVSDDGGHTWQQVVSPAQASSGFSRAIAAASHERAFIIGSRTGLLMSNDGGGTWQQQLPDHGGNGFQAVSFIDAAHGWALHGSDEGDPPGTIATVWRTTDGGTTWSRAALP